MAEEKLQIQCPLQGPIPFVACSIDEITPLIEHLALNIPVSGPTVFPRGTVLPDGRLDLCKQNLGPTGCRSVAKSLHNHQHIRSLLLGTDGIGDEGAVAISELVQANSALEIIYLGCNGITNQGAETLVKTLSNNSTIEGLWLKRNPIGDQGAEAISRLLTQNQTLRVLDLVNTGFGRRGVQSLCRSLRTAGCSIERLYLGGNALDAFSAKELAEVLRSNKTLRALYLNVSLLGDQGAIAIAEGLRANKTLCELGLASNGLTVQGVQPLLETITTHPSLVNLDLGYSPSTKALRAQPNSVGDEGAVFVAKMLQANTKLKRINLAKTGIGKLGRATIEQAIMNNRSIQDCTLDGGLTETTRSHLLANRQDNTSALRCSRDTSLIRSVYRSAK